MENKSNLFPLSAPLHAQEQLISRCLQPLACEAIQVLDTLEMTRCTDLVTVVQQWNTHELWTAGALKGLLEFFEENIKAMFPFLVVE